MPESEPSDRTERLGAHVIAHLPAGTVVTAAAVGALLHEHLVLGRALTTEESARLLRRIRRKLP
jgi:hypothetical protein